MAEEDATRWKEARPSGAGSLLSELTAHLIERSDAASGRSPSERELAARFSASRGRIREALAILEALRIIERRPKSGIFLTAREAGIEAMALFAGAGVPLHPQQIRDAVELRKIHEVNAAGLACLRAGQENYARLQDVLSASERRIAQGEGLAGEDRNFHLEIVRATGNALFYRACSVYYLLHQDSASLPDSETSSRLHAEHLLIYDALLKRDGDLARALMSAHLQHTKS